MGIKINLTLGALTLELALKKDDENRKRYERTAWQ